MFLLVGATGPVSAEEFTFRRVGVPNSGGNDRITVQIGVASPAMRSTSARRLGAPLPRGESGPHEAASDAAAKMAGVAWFWTGVSPLLSDAGPGRLEVALEVIADAPSGAVVPAAPEALRDLAEVYGSDILRLTAGTRVPPDMVLAVMAVESAGRSGAVSPAGAAGLMQLMPATAARFGVQDRLEPAESIRGGVAYLDWLLNHFGEDPILALAAYNAGEGAVEANGGVPPFTETRDYVPKVLATWAVARDLCEVGPEHASGSCAFVLAGL